MDDESAKNIVQVLAAVLQKLIDANDSRSEPGKVTKFHALRAPSITVRNYLERILKYANCSGECFVLALVYIDRLIQRNNYVINSLNVHRIVITSVMLAAKFFDDHYYNNTYYAKIGGVPRNEMNLLELEFLFLVNFSLYLDPDEYRKYHTELCSENTRAAMFSVPEVTGGVGSTVGSSVAFAPRSGFPAASPQPGDMATQHAAGSRNAPASGTSWDCRPFSSEVVQAPAAATASSTVMAIAHNSTHSAAMEVETEAPASSSAPMDIDTDSD